MKLQHYINELQQLIPLDRGRTDERLLIQFLNEQRSIALKNEFNAGRSIDDLVVQTIIVEMDFASQKMVENSMLFSQNSNILKSKISIPTTLDRHYSDTITKISPATLLAEPFNYIRHDQAYYSGTGLVNHREIYAFIFGDYLFIKLSKANPKIKFIDYVAVSGVFEDPREAFLINNPKKDVMEMEYPIPIHTWTYIKETIVNQGLIGVQADVKEAENPN